MPAGGEPWGSLVLFSPFNSPSALTRTAQGLTLALASMLRRSDMIINCGKVSKKTRGILLLLFLESGAYPLFLM